MECKYVFARTSVVQVQVLLLTRKVPEAASERPFPSARLNRLVRKDCGSHELHAPPKREGDPIDVLLLLQLHSRVHCKYIPTIEIVRKELWSSHFYLT
jgi:hypothetical protein